LRQVGDLMVLAAGEVPGQPGNRVGFRIRAVRGDFASQTVGEVDHELSYPPECVNQNLLRVFSHITERYWPWLRLQALGLTGHMCPLIDVQSPDRPRTKPDRRRIEESKRRLAFAESKLSGVGLP
jgi:hypothetical protein